MTLIGLVEAIRWRARHRLRLVPQILPKLQAWLAFRRNRSAYRILSEAELRATRKTDTVFIFGSGYSLNSIAPEEYRAMEAFDTIGFNWFVRQRFVRCDYHFLREVGIDDFGGTWRDDLEEYFEPVRKMPGYAKTVFMIQSGFRAASGNRAIGYGFVPTTNPLFLWHTLDGRTTPSESLQAGLAHTHGTISECINFAALMGWRHIVLAGVDLYDRRYFWLGQDEPRGNDTSVEALHNTAVAGVVDGIREWRDIYASQDIHLYVYNPRSLLAPTLPVWRWPARAAER